MSDAIRIAFVLSVLWPSAPTIGQTTALPVPRYGTPYRELKRWHEQSLRMDGSADKRLDYVRVLVRAKYGQRGLERLFHNFTGRGAIDPRIPGIENNIRFCLSDNPNVARGARRTQLYANRIYNDRRFTLLGVNEPTQTPIGATDKDIRYRHRSTGLTGRIEVKDWDKSTQQRNPRKIEAQIRKMASSYQQTGELQVLMNRKEFIPPIHEYAKRYGITVYDSVATGRKTSQAAGATPIEHVLDDLDRRSMSHTRARLVRGGAAISFGVLTAWHSSKAGKSAWERLLREDADQRNWNRFGHHSSMTIAGIGMAVAGSGQMTSPFLSGRPLAGPINVLTRIGGSTAVVALLVAQGFLVGEYVSGSVSTREFMISQTSLAGGLAGGLAAAWAGAKVGAAIGVCFGPWGVPIGGTIGALTGSLAGVRVGSSAAEHAIGRWYSFQDAENERLFREFVYSHYGAERVNRCETTVFRNSCMTVAVTFGDRGASAGGLIETSAGSLRGWGDPWTNRSGCSA